MWRVALGILVWGAGTGILEAADLKGQPLAGTKPLTMQGDIASQMIAGIDKFLLRQTQKTIEQRSAYWEYDFSSAQAYEKSIEPNRKRLAHMLGLRDRRVPFDQLELVATVDQPALVGQGEGFKIYAVRWPVLPDPHPGRDDTMVYGQGLLLEPDKGRASFDVIAIPDCEQLPEQIAGLTKGVKPSQQFARRLAEAGCRVVVPLLINRKVERRGDKNWPGHYRANLSNREFLYRPSFALGRHIIGYELQKVLALVDLFEKQAAARGAKDNSRKTGKQIPIPPRIGVWGHGEGGMLALYAGALDRRIRSTVISGYFGPRKALWTEPIDRNVFGRLREFGDADLLSMMEMRSWIIHASANPSVLIEGNRAAPGRIQAFSKDQIRQEVSRMETKLDQGLKQLKGPKFVAWSGVIVPGQDPTDDPLERTIAQFFDAFVDGPAASNAENMTEHLRKHFNPQQRHLRQVQQIDRHTQALLGESIYVRANFMKKLDNTIAKGLDEYQKVAAEYRKKFAEETIGRFDEKLLPANARTRKVFEQPKWTGYEVVLDVYPDVIAFGILLVPKDLKEGQKRPVVVCQHGLEGRPRDTIEKDHGAYHDFAAKLCERGFIVFAPQNPYIFKDRFRTLQRKANPLGKTLFSIIVPQHQQITDWLKSLPFVDGKRIGFYGLSYGGKTAMRVPALVDNYALSICSADFNEWVWKNASTRTRYTYVFTGEYEIFEWDLGSTFNYAEMAALICPRPFMVERGHRDGVAPDEQVAYEYAKVRRRYDRLGIGKRTRIEFFVGPHTIHGVGTFEFLHRNLNWPPPGN